MLRRFNSCGKRFRCWKGRPIKVINYTFARRVVNVLYQFLIIKRCKNNSYIISKVSKQRSYQNNKLNTDQRFYINNFFNLELGFYKILLRLSHSTVNLFLKFLVITISVLIYLHQHLLLLIILNIIGQLPNRGTPMTGCQVQKKKKKK